MVMTLPNLIIPGAGKSGTTSLHGLLQQHPAVHMSERKEPHFFSREPSEARRRDYESLFEGASGHSIRGESSTSYMIIAEAPVRMMRVLDRPKIIFIFRNPVERVYSHYRWLRSQGLEGRSLRRAFLADRDVTPSMADSVFRSSNYRYYFHHSAYGSALERFFECFDRKLIKIVTFERLVDDYRQVMKECFRFLGVFDEAPIQAVQSNVTKNVSPIRGRARYLVRAAYFKFRWLRRLRKAYEGPSRAALGLVERASHTLWLDELSREDRAWLARELEAEVTKLRWIWGGDFLEWRCDFPL